MLITVSLCYCNCFRSSWISTMETNYKCIQLIFVINITRWDEFTTSSAEWQVTAADHRCIDLRSFINQSSTQHQSSSFSHKSSSISHIGHQQTEALITACWCLMHQTSHGLINRGRLIDLEDVRSWSASDL